MTTSHTPDGSEQSSVLPMSNRASPAIFANSFVGYPVLPKGEIEFVAVTDLPHISSLDQLADLFSPLENLKLRAPITGGLAFALDILHLREHFRQATMQLQADLKLLTEAAVQYQETLTRIKQFRDAGRQWELEEGRSDRRD